MKLNNIFKRKKIKEQDFIDAVDKITKKLIYKFKFGYHELDDMKQQATLFALEGLERYDSSRPLENFLWTHVRNRLFNFKRDNYFRPDNICVECPFFDPSFKKSNNACAKFTNKEDCPIYSGWQHKNNSKKNIMTPENIENNNNTNNTPSLIDTVSSKEIIDLIEKELDLEHRETYLKIKSGAKASKQDVDDLKRHILEILEKNKDKK